MGCSKGFNLGILFYTSLNRLLVCRALCENLYETISCLNPADPYPQTSNI